MTVASFRSFLTRGACGWAQVVTVLPRPLSSSPDGRPLDSGSEPRFRVVWDGFAGLSGGHQVFEAGYSSF